MYSSIDFEASSVFIVAIKDIYWFWIPFQAAGDYRNRKRDQEEQQMQEHEDLLKLRDGLREQQATLMQELKFALKMAEARLKRMQ